MNTRRRSLLLAPLALALALLLGGTGTGPALADAPAPDNSTARYEVRFLTGMIEHHSMAVRMAELCETRAVHPELLELCAEIKAAQMAEIELMQGWLLDWYGIAFEPEMTAGMMRRMEMLAALSGAEFEVEFLKMMIRHHWQAVIEASQCERRVYHEALRGLCEEIVAAQTEEIEQMREWLCAWYGVCNYGPKGRTPR